MNKVTTYDMEQINSYSAKELSPDDVYVFTAKLCDNDIDADSERFTIESLFVLKKLLVGKTGILDCGCSDEHITMRIISCDIEYIEDKVTAVGEPYYRLMVRVYMMKNNYTQSIIEQIENGDIDKVSIGCSVRSSMCSICHIDINSPLCCHQKGKKYGEELCFVELTEPTDVYEFSFALESPPKNKVTNYGNMIKGLTEKKLAKLMADSNRCTKRPNGVCTNYRNEYPCSACCYRCWLDWLKQEVEK